MGRSLVKLMASMALIMPKTALSRHGLASLHAALDRHAAAALSALCRRA